MVIRDINAQGNRVKYRTFCAVFGTLPYACSDFKMKSLKTKKNYHVHVQKSALSDSLGPEF